jgi:hypothetical protein
LDQGLAVDIADDAQAIIIVGVDYVGAPAGETGSG